MVSRPYWDGTSPHLLPTQPEEQVPLNPTYGVPDWDDAPGAIVWPKMAKELAFVKQTGHFSDNHYSHDHMNAQNTIPVDEEVLQRWRKKFQQIHANRNAQGQKIQIALVDGFLLYYSPDVYNSLDVRIFLREPEAVVRERRAARTYHTAGKAADCVLPQLSSLTLC